MATRLELINRALALIGEQSLEFESPEAAAAFGDQGVVDPEDDLQRIAGAAYPIVRAAMLFAHPWSWNTRRDVLVAHPATGNDNVGEWPYPMRYRLPSPEIGIVRAVFDQNASQSPRTTGWEVQNGYLYATFDVAWVDTQRQVDETVWPELFANAVTIGLAAELAMPIKEDVDTMRIYQRKAEAALNDAMRVDAQGQPVKTIPRFDWEEARLAEQFGYYRHAVT